MKDGLGVAWPIQTKWGRLDASAATLRRIAEEQVVTGGSANEVGVHLPGNAFDESTFGYRM